MPSKEFWSLLCHPCSLMSSSRKQKDSPTEKKPWLWQSCGRFYEWFIYSLHPWCEKRKSLLWLNRQLPAAAQLSSPLHIRDSSAMDAHGGSEEKSYCSREAISKCSPAPSTWLPNISLGTSFGGATPRAQNLFNYKVWSSWFPRDLWQPCREAANSNTLCGCGNRMIRALKVHHNLGNSLPILLSWRKSTQDAQEGFQSSISLFPFSLSQIQHFSWILAFSFAKRATHSWRQWLQHGASWSSVLSLSGRIITFWFKHSLS